MTLQNHFLTHFSRFNLITFFVNFQFLHVKFKIYFLRTNRSHSFTVLAYTLSFTVIPISVEFYYTVLAYIRRLFLMYLHVLLFFLYLKFYCTCL
jgi:hypothetical protein